MSTTQATEYFGVNIKTIRRWIASGKLSADLIDGRWHVHIEGDNVPPNGTPNVQSLQSHLKRDGSEIKHLREQLARRDEQIDHLTQLLAIAQNNVSMLTERMQVIEDMRHRKPFWKRLFRQK